MGGFLEAYILVARLLIFNFEGDSSEDLHHLIGSAMEWEIRKDITA